MAKVRPLTTSEARASLAARLGARVDRVRQLSTRMGLRPLRVFLIWTEWTGAEHGEGTESVVCRHEIIPTPRVVDISNVALKPMSAGLVAEGTLKVDRVTLALTDDMLHGKRYPISGAYVEPRLGVRGDFFYEVVEDGRGDDCPERRRFRLAAEPARRAGEADWVLVLERTAGDLSREGVPRRAPAKRLGDGG